MKFKEMYTESFESEIQKIKKMTDDNDHNGARIEGAKLIKNRKLEMAYTGIDNINYFLGHSPQELGKLRAELDKTLFAQAKSKLGKNFEEFKSAF